MITALITLAFAQTPTVTVLAHGPARPVVVVIDGQALTLTTVPLVGPTPIPPAPPAPDPVPTPVPGKLWVSLIVQANDAGQANLRTAEAVRALAKAGEIELRTYTHDDPALTGIKLDQYVAKHGTPVVVIQGEKGNVLESGKVADADSVVKAVRRYKP